jgi:TRAP-type C4-dicarboxylate transport system permease small subunit
VVVTGLAAYLGWRGWTVLSGYGPARSIQAGQFELAGPAVLGFVLIVFLIEQVRPAQRRPCWPAAICSTWATCSRTRCWSCR